MAEQARVTDFTASGPYDSGSAPPANAGPFPATSMKIRPAAVADRERIHAILAATRRFTRQEIGWAMELIDQASMQPSKGDYEAYVLEEPSSGPRRAIRGYVLFGPTPMSDGVFDLYWIAVDPEWQGRGMGRELLRFVENEVRRQGGRMLLIETSSKRSYEPTVRFYQRAGYQEISRIKDFYRVEDDKVVFARTLNEP